MNNYLITIFKQNNEIEFQTLSANDIDTAMHIARSMLKMMHEIEFDSTWPPNGNTKYSNAGIGVHEIK